MQKTIEQCFKRGESVVFIETHDKCNSEELMSLAETSGYKVWTVDESEEFKPDFGEHALDSEEFREPSHKKCFYHLTLSWNNTLADRDSLDIWFITYLKHQLNELICEADSRWEGLEVPVNVIIDNMAILKFAVEDLDGFIAMMQRRERWRLKIITCL